MGRYYLVATILVVGALIVGGLFSRPHKPSDSIYARSTGTPSAPRPHASSMAPQVGVEGNAPWALSALPECFVQMAKVRGPSPFVRSRLPHGMERIAAGFALSTADCTLHVGTNFGVVDRGTEHLVIPPETRFYAAGARIAVLRRSGNFAELRLYQQTGGLPLAIWREKR